MSETGSRTLLLEFEADIVLETAREAATEGQCVVLLTDTAYGIGYATFNAKAVTGLLEVKKRGRDMPPPVLIVGASMLRALVSQVPETARKLVAWFWPGALTIIAKAQRSFPLDLGETRGTVAVRAPDHDQARALLRRTGPMAVSSANVSGQPAVITAGEARRMLAEAVAVYLDGGRAPGGKASTTIDSTGDEHGWVLRQGAIDLEELRKVVPELQAGRCANTLLCH